MSMILDALTRAEQDRQIEKQPDLKFATPVKQPQSKSTNVWMWVFLALIANAVVLAVFLRPGNSPEASVNEPTEIASENLANEIAAPIQEPTDSTSNQLTSLDRQSDLLSNEPVETNAAPTSEAASTRPLAMELEHEASVGTDRPLIYEAKQTKTLSQSKLNNVQTSAQKDNTPVKKEGAVSFSQTELNVDETAQPIANAPKLLIDQGDNNSSVAYVPNLRDLPESSRSDLKQYEVNVHVFDDNPERRFVLINMDKYKEGERISNNGPLVQEITREGVIVDYGSGRALLPPK